MQFRENLSDRQGADAVRSRIDWKYLLGLELTDSGFDFSVLSEFRHRLIAGQAEHLLLEALLQHCIKAARFEHASPSGQQRYQRRAGIEGTISQGVRAFGLRRSCYRGLSKTHLQNIAVAAALNIERIVNWLNEVPRAKTCVSRFAALAES
jgi:transposase